MSSAQVQEQRPSDDRRAALRKAEGEMGGGVPLVSNFFSIDRYYAAADKVLASFEKAYNEKRLDDAYVLGKRFCVFSLEGLPKHDYYKSPKYASLRKHNDACLKQVVPKLEQVVKWMDEEEAEKQRLLQERRRLLTQAKIKRQQEIEKARYQELQHRIEQQRRKDARSTQENVEQSALTKLQMLNASSGSIKTDASNGPVSRENSASFRRSIHGVSQRLNSQLSDMDLGESIASMGSSLSPMEQDAAAVASGRTRRSRWPEQDAVGLGKGDEMLPPPIPPPSFPPPPSYDQVVTDHDKLHNAASHLYPPAAASQRRPIAASAGGAIVAPEESFPEPLQDSSVPLVPPPPYSFYDRDSVHIPEPPKVAPVKRIPLRQLKQMFNLEFSNLKRAKKIEVFGLDTYQGRLRHSTNGCTVISPLVVSHHLKEPGSVADATIVNVIDKECPPLLRDIRNKLELESDALIIPSDVHDYLVDRKILIQEKFAGACGGNILDEKHIGEFLKILEGGETGDHKERKTGAAFFFREHVVSIVKVPIGQGNFCYDMVDSMPRLTDPNNGNKMMASRTRCHGLDAFAALLGWYACGKFTESNAAYIDRNEWDEMMADFDPRVFQAFVWTE